MYHVCVYIRIGKTIYFLIHIVLEINNNKKRGFKFMHVQERV